MVYADDVLIAADKEKNRQFNYTSASGRVGEEEEEEVVRKA